MGPAADTHPRRRVPTGSGASERVRTVNEDLYPWMERIEALLERIADAVAPTPEQRAASEEEDEFEKSRKALATWTYVSWYPSDTTVRR